MITLTMCADQHCANYATCYRAQAKAAPDQRFWAVSPREGNSCRFYAPMTHTDGASAMKDDRAMTRDDIIRMAREAGMTGLSLVDIGYLERFASLVAAAERESCAQICDYYASADHANYADSCAEAIRARSKA